MFKKLTSINYSWYMLLKVKTSIGNASISKNEMEALYYQSCERICFDYR